MIDVTGKTFGKLTIRKMLPGSLCESDCECGTTEFVTESYSVRKGLTTSCGCHVRELLTSGKARRTHGEASTAGWTPEYRAWVNMNSRCYIPSVTRFKNWGGRGIRVFDGWRHHYPAFLAHVGRRPSPIHSLDRYPDPDGHYEPGNVRWATPEQQAANKRRRAA